MRARWTLVLSLAIGCHQAKHEPGPEYKAAIEAFEQAVVETGDYEYTHERFDDVLRSLRTVPEPDREAAASLALDIETKRAAALGRKKKIELEMDANRRAADLDESARAARAAASGDVVPPGWGTGESAPPSDYRRPPPSGADNAAKERDANAALDQAYREAKAKRMAEEARHARERAATDRAESQKRTAERLEQRKQEVMNEELDPSKWECNQITNVCRAKITVPPEQVKKP